MGAREGGAAAAVRLSAEGADTRVFVGEETIEWCPGIQVH